MDKALEYNEVKKICKSNEIRSTETERNQILISDHMFLKIKVIIVNYSLLSKKVNIKFCLGI